MYLLIINKALQHLIIENLNELSFEKLILDSYLNNYLKDFQQQSALLYKQRNFNN